MASPFPGMNPYLEHPQLWPEVHNRLIIAIANAIESNLSRKYRVAIEKRTYTSLPEDSIIVGIPDISVISKKSNTNQTPSTITIPDSGEYLTVTLPTPQEVRESYLEIRDVSTGYVVTAIEVLSPTNKRPGKGREAYENKRMEVLSSSTNLVEIDLLRSGTPMPILNETPQTDYRILVALGNRRPLAQLYTFSLRNKIPSFMLPLLPGKTELLLDLQSLLIQVYDQARYDLAIDYTLEPEPPLNAEDRTWADALLKEKGLRI